MPTIPLIRKSRGQSADGRVRWQLPGVALVVPTERELRDLVLKHVRDRLIEQLSGAASRWQGFASWLSSHLVIEGGAVRWPPSEAADRLGLLGLDEDWLDEVVTDVLKQAIRVT